MCPSKRPVPLATQVLPDKATYCDRAHNHDYVAWNIIVDEFPGASAKELESVEQGPMEGFLPLGVGELRVEQPAMAFDDGQAIELAGSAP